ncbi:LysR family transcriptional regulator [Echinimonas agarilytica]|uniref:LysR family transcriptional regulator n=1 Tax=Echinimonas agarilytica TaxID=1215918 RepID=A0AA42B7F6_9GAMM|nr:LysR family transcriptional regulator [Echinimonas agarilytica]MCM2679762.1 LysR family transcriptional regulator [Echinimonas agarilytica]
MNITLDQLKVLVAVNTSGSFSKTAELLGQTPSAISRKIGQLERQLNIQLFTRTTRRISLTNEGRIITEKAQLALTIVNDIQDNAALSHGEPAGKLKVDAPTPFLEHCIMPYIDGFMKKYPKIQLELASFDHQIDLIAEQVDVAFRIGELKDSSLHYRRVGKSPLRIIASPEYLKNHGVPNHVNDLHQHACIGFSQPLSLNHWPLIQDEQSKAFELNTKLACSSGSLIRQATLNGMGIACLADFMTRNDLTQGRLVQVLTDATITQYQPIHAVFYKPYQSSLKLKCFVDFIIESIADQLQ